jgi:hypothetical protein
MHFCVLEVLYTAFPAEWELTCVGGNLDPCHAATFTIV